MSPGRSNIRLVHARHVLLQLERLRFVAYILHQVHESHVTHKHGGKMSLWQLSITVPRADSSLLSTLMVHLTMLLSDTDSCARYVFRWELSALYGGDVFSLLQPCTLRTASNAIFRYNRKHLGGPWAIRKAAKL